MKKVLAVLGVVVLIAGAGAGGVWLYFERQLAQFLATPFGSAESKSVDVPPGTNPRALATLLEQAKVVSDNSLLYAYLRRDKLGPKLKAGEYEFSGPLTPAQVIEKITSGQVKLYRFTVPEGLRVDEILPILAGSDLKLRAEVLKQLAEKPDWVRKLGVPADSMEGFLFPDTYSFPKGANEETVLKAMAHRTLDEFKKAPRKAGVTLNLLEAITLSSIVEKETGAVEERPRISCVFHNRLRLKMKLQTDPTVIYAAMMMKGRYSKNITRADLEADHPYNTYTRKGLPPGPIASAGAAAIRAALSPIDCTDLFFVSKNDGTHVFCPDLKCHEDNVQKWQVQYFRGKKPPDAGTPNGG